MLKRGKLIQAIREIENKIGLSKLDSELTAYEEIDLELKILDLKNKIGFFGDKEETTNEE